MRIVVDADVCMGHGRCNAVAPDLFPLDELGFSSVRGRGPVEVPHGSEAAAQAGVNECPERAIEVVD